MPPRARTSRSPAATPSAARRSWRGSAQAAGRRTSSPPTWVPSVDAVTSLARSATEALGGRDRHPGQQRRRLPRRADAHGWTRRRSTPWSRSTSARPCSSTQAIAGPMVERGAGVIVNVSSWVATVGLPTGALYAASKATLDQLTRGWAAEFGPSGVRVNAVAPGHHADRGQPPQRGVPGGGEQGLPGGSRRATGGDRGRGGVPGLRQRLLPARRDALRGRGRGRDTYAVSAWSAS